MWFSVRLAHSPRSRRMSAIWSSGRRSKRDRTYSTARSTSDSRSPGSSKTWRELDRGRGKVAPILRRQGDDIESLLLTATACAFSAPI